MIDDFDNDCRREKYCSRVNIRTGFVELPVSKSPGKKENWCEGDTAIDPNTLKVKKDRLVNMRIQSVRILRDKPHFQSTKQQLNDEK